ncbi:mechanosensitive ion channel family protein [Alphaproteobacteria bacterium]|nr:mechanosensitive ion channel family protein [Alphaproteobacteria bacterium]
MDYFSKIYFNFNYLIDYEIFGMSLINYILLFFLFIIAILFNGLIASFIIKKIKAFVKKTNNKIDDKLFDALIPPFKFLPIVLVFFFLSLSFDNQTNIGLLIIKINNSLATIFIFWLMHQSLIPLSLLFDRLEQILSKALVTWIINALKYLIIFLGIAAILETWGIKVGPVIAGLGLLGVAVALGAQDLFKNLISGIMILMEKRFHIGDVIKVPGHTEGVVEYIGFRSTLIRKFDSSPITIPNYIFAEAPILNYSNRNFRRINWTIGVEYNSTLDQIKKFTEIISNYIENSDNFTVNEKYNYYVKLEKFNDSSIDILIICFTSTKDWEKYLQIKEELALKIKESVEKIGLNFAFPSQSIYIEKN